MSEDIKLPKSLRKHIRQKKAEIRKRFGQDSPQEREFLEMVRKKKKEKQGHFKKPSA